MTKLYITEALRWGDDENHSYVVGVYSTREQAEYAGNVEKSWRGGKYEPRVTEAILDEVEDKKIQCKRRRGFEKLLKSIFPREK